MGFILVTRNPTTKKIVIISTNDDCDDVVEYDTEQAADAAAAKHQLCISWGYEAIEIDDGEG